MTIAIAGELGQHGGRIVGLRTAPQEQRRLGLRVAGEKARQLETGIAGRSQHRSFKFGRHHACFQWDRILVVSP